MSLLTNTPLHFLGVAQLSQMLEKGQISSQELTQTLLAHIKTNTHLGAFLSFDEQIALAQAKAADESRAQGNATPLTGIPLAHKDLFVTTEYPTTAASKMLEGYMSPFDATVVSKLKEAGTVTLGKLNCDEFAMGGSNENSAFYPVLNPWDATRVPGGSSGGSAAAVAAGLVPVATGSDSGGSIRQPSSFTNITGIKATYGRCSRHGMIAFASSFDQAGVMSHSALDCAMVLKAISGFDERDSTSVERPVDDFVAQTTATRNGTTATHPLKGLRIGIPQEFMSDNIEVGVQHIIRAALSEYEKLGATLVDISLPQTKLAVPVYYTLAPAEASSNMSCFDGVRYGYRTPNTENLEQLYSRSRSEALGEEVKRRILMGTYVLSEGYYDAYYLKAQKIRRIIAQDLQHAFTQCDVIAGPVAPSEPWKTGVITKDPLLDYLADIFTLPASLAGLPAMSLPAGFTTNRLPVGLHLIGNYWQEGQILHAAHAFQQATDWHQQNPAGF
ncbi:MAG: Asp-tRNA(Asn)/Glu-tRNA(Gln) amidotransferase subunit GatA [Saezia sp.]